jgi:hypothetical protein
MICISSEIFIFELLYQQRSKEAERQRYLRAVEEPTMFERGLTRLLVRVGKLLETLGRNIQGIQAQEHHEITSLDSSRASYG